MIHMVEARQNRLFDPFQGVIPPAGQRIIAEGWQGVFRHALLEVMPVGELAENFSRELGASHKELYSMAGLVFLADFFGWTTQEAIEVTSSGATSSTPSTSSPASQSRRAPSNAIRRCFAMTNWPSRSSRT